MKSCPIRTPDYVKLEQEVGTKAAFALFSASGVTPELRTTNGKPSKIYPELEKKLGEKAAVRVKAWTYSKSYVTSKEFLQHKGGELALYHVTEGDWMASSAKTGNIAAVLRPYETAPKGARAMAVRIGTESTFATRAAFNEAAAEWGKNLSRSQEQIRGAYMTELLSKGIVTVGQDTFVAPRRIEPFDADGNWIPWHKRRAGAALEAAQASEVFTHVSGKQITPQPKVRINSKSLNRADRAMARTAKAAGATVVYDTSLKEKGDVRRVGQDIVVRINPNLAGADTLPHELGHVLIDSMGGLSDPLVAAGIEQLKGTDLWKQVQQSYSERSADVRAKEVLATAIGLEAAALMGDGEKARKWTAWLALFFSKIKQVLGLEQNVVKVLAARVVLGRMPSDVDWKRFNEEYQSKKPKVDLDKAKLAELAREIQKKAHDLDIEVGRLKDREGFETNKDRIAKYKQLQIELETMISNGMNDPETALVLLQTLALEELSGVMKAIETYLADPDTQQIYPSDLLKFRQMSSLFNLQSIMNAQLKALPADHPQRARFLSAGASIETLRTEIENFYLGKGREIVTHILMDYDNFTERKWQKQAEKEYKETLPAGEKADPLKMAEYVDAFMIENEEKVMQDSFDRIYASLLSTKGDIGWMEMMLNSIKNMDDSLLPMLADLIDSTAVRAENEFIRLERLHADKLKALQVAKGNPNSYETLYAEILERDAAGNLTGNLTGRFLQQFNDTIAAEMNKAYELLQVSTALYQNAVDLIIQTYMTPLSADEIRDKMEALTQLHGTDKAKKIRATDVFFNYRPLDIYSNPQYDVIMSKDPDDALRAYYESLMDLREYNDAQGPEWAKQNQRLPFVRKTGLDDLNMGKMGLGTMRQWWANQSERKSDDDDTQTVRKDASGRMIYSLPLFFRRGPDYDVSEQSFDVGTIMMMETANRTNYKYMHQIASQIDLAMDIIGEREVQKTKGKASILLRSDTDREIPDKVLEKQTKRYQALVSHVEDRVYGMSRASDDPLNVDHKHVQLLMNATSLVMLGGNVLAGMANITLGKVLLLGEAAGGQYMDKETLAAAYVEYSKDMGAITGDLGRDKHESRTNQLGDTFDPANDGRKEIFRYGQNSTWKKLATRSTLQAANTIGEHMLAHISMYAVLHKIKVLGADGKYIKADGTSTENVAEGINLAQAYSANADGEQRLMKGASAILLQGRKLSLEGSARGRTITRVRHIIQQTNEDLYGAYGENNKAMAQRYAVGQMVMMFRKWMPAGFRRRYRGIGKVWINQVPAERWSQFYNDSHEGTYTTPIRFLWQSYREVQAAKAGELAMEQYGKYMPNLKRLWENRSEMEASNLRRTAVEASFILGAAVLTAALRDMAEDAPEDEEPYWYLAAFVSRRLYAELFFYSNLSEFMNVLRTPAASLSYLEELLEVVFQTFSMTETYESGRRKGQYKLWKEFTDVVPFYKQFDSVFNAKERLAFYN